MNWQTYWAGYRAAKEHHYNTGKLEDFSQTTHSNDYVKGARRYCNMQRSLKSK